MLTSELWDKTGGLSDPSKMWWFGWSVPAWHCKRGAKLAKCKGTICSVCFAKRGRYVFKNVQKAQERRLTQYNENNVEWRNAMVELLAKKSRGSERRFRWFDAGDLQSVQMLMDIIHIAYALPYIKFWLPTREIGMVSEAMKQVSIPDNLCIRISADMIGQVRNHELPTSSVSANNGHLCPASRGEVTCKQANCTACYEKTVKNVDYLEH